jgi:hypothetical protein
MAINILVMCSKVVCNDYIEKYVEKIITVMNLVKEKGATNFGVALQ